MVLLLFCEYKKYIFENKHELYLGWRDDPSTKNTDGPCYPWGSEFCSQHTYLVAHSHLVLQLQGNSNTSGLWTPRIMYLFLLTHIHIILKVACVCVCTHMHHYAYVEDSFPAVIIFFSSTWVLGIELRDTLNMLSHLAGLRIHFQVNGWYNLL